MWIPIFEKFCGINFCKKGQNSQKKISQKFISQDFILIRYLNYSKPRPWFPLWAFTFIVLAQLFHSRCFAATGWVGYWRSDLLSFDFFNPHDQGKIRTRFVLEKQSMRDLNYWLNKNARKHPQLCWVLFSIFVFFG